MAGERGRAHLTISMSFPVHYPNYHHYDYHHGTHQNRTFFLIEFCSRMHKRIHKQPQQWTRLIRFIAAETSQVHIGQPIDPNLDGKSLLFTSSSLTYVPPVGLAAWNKQTIKAFEIVGSALDPAAQVTNTILTVKELLAPLSREELKIVRCLGLNYSDHAVCPFFLISVLLSPTHWHARRVGRD